MGTGLVATTSFWTISVHMRPSTLTVNYAAVSANTRRSTVFTVYCVRVHDVTKMVVHRFPRGYGEALQYVSATLINMRCNFCVLLMD